MTNDDEYRNTPEWQAWAEETKRRSEAMTNAVHPLGKVFDQETVDEGEATEGGSDP